MGLVLSRSAQEAISIGDDITITVVEVGKGKVKLAITAPPSLVIERITRDGRVERNVPVEERPRK